MSGRRRESRSCKKAHLAIGEEGDMRRQRFAVLVGAFFIGVTEPPVIPRTRVVKDGKFNVRLR